MYRKLLYRFDLSIGETFSYKENIYVVRDNGIYKRINAKKWIIDTELMADMLVGNIDSVKMWHPALGVDYYIFDTITNTVKVYKWTGSELDNCRFESGLVCQTEEEAEKLGKKIINYLKQEY